MLAYEFEGKRYDCGSKLGYLQATVEYALNHSSLGKEFEKYLLELAQSRLDRSSSPEPLWNLLDLTPEGRGRTGIPVCAS